jgi:hypothetical protein
MGEELEAARRRDRRRSRLAFVERLGLRLIEATAGSAHHLRYAWPKARNGRPYDLDVLIVVHADDSWRPYLAAVGLKAADWARSLEAFAGTVKKR